MAGTPKRETTADRYENIRTDYKSMYYVKKMRAMDVYRDLGEKYGLSPRTIRDICTGSSR